MLSPSALLRLPYHPSLTLGGIEYAKKSLHYTYNRMHLGAAARLRKIVAGVAVELAFQRWLDANAVPYDRLGLTAFTEKDKYDLALGGRRCDLKSFLISDKRKIAALRQNPAALLEASALVPDDQFRSDSMSENDFYLFGFLLGRETRRREEMDIAIANGHPTYLVFAPQTEVWRGEPVWQSLGRLALKCDTREALDVEVGGQDDKRAALVENVVLTPRMRAQTRAEFFSLLYLHVPRLPGGVVGVSSSAVKDLLLIDDMGWVNIWIYGVEIVLAGWLTKGEFRARSQRLPAGSAVWQYPSTKTDNRALPIRELRSIESLAALIKNSEWGKR